MGPPIPLGMGGSRILTSEPAGGAVVTSMVDQGHGVLAGARVVAWPSGTPRLACGPSGSGAVTGLACRGMR